LVWHRHRDRVEGLVLCATSRNFGGTLQERLFYRLLPALSAAIRLAGRGQAPDGAIAEVGAALGFGPDAMLSRWALSELGRVSPSVMLQACNAMGRFSSHAWIGDVHVPTAVVV